MALCRDDGDDLEDDPAKTNIVLLVIYNHAM